jgi:hypothetical protein
VVLLSQTPLVFPRMRQRGGAPVWSSGVYGHTTRWFHGCYRLYTAERQPATWRVSLVLYIRTTNDRPRDRSSL